MRFLDGALAKLGLVLILLLVLWGATTLGAVSNAREYVAVATQWLSSHNYHDVEVVNRSFFVVVWKGPHIEGHMYRFGIRAVDPAGKAAQCAVFVDFSKAVRVQNQVTEKRVFGFFPIHVSIVAGVIVLLIAVRIVLMGLTGDLRARCPECGRYTTKIGYRYEPNLAGSPWIEKYRMIWCDSCNKERIVTTWTRMANTGQILKHEATRKA
jgi:hypothetical protein